MFVDLLHIIQKSKNTTNLKVFETY